jgi:alpha-D-ribose 1-methylphosphonate 5-triphosphate synthase subunit PhnH
MTDLTPGFASALDAQACFRAILRAFSTPGTAVTLPVAPVPPPGLSPAAAAVLLTLADATTSVALPEANAAHRWLAFHTGARIVAPAAAMFCAARQRPPLTTLPQGTDETPEDGATLILDCAALHTGRPLRLSGPGLEHPIAATLPLDAAFLAEWHAQTRNAPRGVDILLCAGAEILALPRSLTIEEG